MSIGVIIVAAGRGVRLGAAVPKQFLDLGGQTMLERSVAAFDRHPAVAELVIVLPADLVADGRARIGAVMRPCRIVPGGERRQDSVRSGLSALSAEVDVVLIHDAARPFVDAALISRVIDGVRAHGAAVPAVAARDTMKRVRAGSSLVAATIAREDVWLAQTPQGFRREIADQCAALASGADMATDDASLAERLGHPVAVVQGDERNMKVTTDADLAFARAAMTPPRAGTGYDLHRLVDGRRLVLAGVVVDSLRGPLGHSDGDVVCHALVDALFGAAAAGDIGRHFPNTDPAWKDAAGLDLLARAHAIIGENRWTVTSVDVTVVLERPKLAPHIDAIRGAIAGCLSLPLDAVAVKAKTNEGVDAVGRGEAIVAHAIAVLARRPA